MGAAETLLKVLTGCPVLDSHIRTLQPAAVMIASMVSL